jgi:hypothetical protein
MAIPQGRMSTTPVEDIFLPPEARPFKRLISHEIGPVAIEDTSLGLLYQPWTLTYNKIDGTITMLPNTTAIPVVLPTIVFGITDINFTFDQNGRITIAWKVAGNSFLFWFDSSLGYTVTEDLGPDLVSVAIQLDDKRATQSSTNDMILWYTKEDGAGTYTLYNKLQRERYLDEHIMSTLVPHPYLWNIGMHYGLRIQLVVSSEKS